MFWTWKLAWTVNSKSKAIHFGWEFIHNIYYEASNSWRIYYEHLILIFFIFEIFLLSGDTDTTTWHQTIHMNIIQSSTCIYKGLQDEDTIWVPRTLLRTRNELILWVTRTDDIKLHHEFQNTSTIHMQAMILSYELSIISYIISTLLTPSQTHPDAYKLLSASNVQPPTKKIFIWCQTWHISLVSFFHNF